VTILGRLLKEPITVRFEKGKIVEFSGDPEAQVIARRF
jgi:leucyl aminopeptidase (aminopeptidase T)